MFSPYIIGLLKSVSTIKCGRFLLITIKNFKQQ